MFSAVRETPPTSWGKRLNFQTARQMSILFFPWSESPLVMQGLLIIEASRSYSVTHTKLGRTSLEVISPTQKPLLTTNDTQKRQTFMPPSGFEPGIPAS